jgi:hypothetical protein
VKYIFADKSKNFHTLANISAELGNSAPVSEKCLALLDYERKMTGGCKLPYYSVRHGKCVAPEKYAVFK